MRSRLLTLAAILAFPLAAFVACDTTTEPFGPEPEELVPSYAISDAANDGLEGFYFLPPMVKAPTYSGTFDPYLSPVVEICESSDCEELHVRFSMTEGQGSEVVRVEEADEHYIVNWHSRATGAVAGKVYRLRVSVSDVLLGYADLNVVSTGREAVTVRSDGSIALVAGQTLPVKFRIETGIVGSVQVSPATAEVAVDDTQTFNATLFDLHGAVITGPAVAWASSDAEVAIVSGEGVATGLTAGDVVITASVGRAEGSAVLVVNEIVDWSGEWAITMTHPEPDYNLSVWVGLIQFTEAEPGVVYGVFEYRMVVDPEGNETPDSPSGHPDWIRATMSGKHLDGRWVRACGCEMTEVWENPGACPCFLTFLLWSGSVYLEISPCGDRFTGTWVVNPVIGEYPITGTRIDD